MYSYLGHARLVRLATLALAWSWCALCALTARKHAHAHGHGHGQKAEKMNFGANKGTRATVVVLGGLCTPKNQSYFCCTLHALLHVRIMHMHTIYAHGAQT
jgi:hypothetical protein